MLSFTLFFIPNCSYDTGSGIIVHVRRNSISPDLRVRRDRNDNPNVSSPSHGSNIFEVVVENPERSEVKTDSGNTTKETNPVSFVLFKL